MLDENAIVVRNGSITVAEDLEKFKEMISGRVETINAMAVAPTTCISCDQLRKSNTKFLNAVKDKYAEAEAQCLAPLKEKEKAISELLKPLEEANKAFWNQIKEADKLRFKLELKEKYFDESWGQPNEDGEVLDFDSIYEESWESLGSLIKAANAMNNKIRKSMSDYYSKKYKATIVVTATQEKLDELEGFLIKAKIPYEQFDKEE